MKFNIKEVKQLDAVFKQIVARPFPATGWVMNLTEAKNNRTLQQNRYLWDQVYTPMAVQIGDATGTLIKTDHIHALMKDRFSPREIVYVLGETVCTPKSTTKFTKKEFTDYIEKCFAWGAEHGVWFND
jgi:hypothetical protein